MMTTNVKLKFVAAALVALCVAAVPARANTEASARLASTSGTKITVIKRQDAPSNSHKRQEKRKREKLERERLERERLERERRKLYFYRRR